jgi:uncharacterized protein
MKRCFSLALCLLILLLLPVSASASSQYVIDEAHLLTEQEVMELDAGCRQFRETSNMDLVFLTVDTLGGIPAMVYADDYFDAHYAEDGILLLVAMEEREWHISTCGTAIEAFSDIDLSSMEDSLVSKLSNGKYFKAFQTFLSDAEYYWCNEEVSDLDAGLFFGVPSGAVIALIVLFIMRSNMNTKRSQRSAGNYEVEGSFNLRRHQDLFLYSKTSKKEIPKESDKSDSTTHTSSSGRSHGGRGGKF